MYFRTGNVHMKTPVVESLFNKYAYLKTCNFIKKRFQHRCFPVKLAKLLRTPFFTEHIQWLLLEISHELSLFIAFENNEWCHFVVRIGSPAFISFFLRVFHFILFLSLFLAFFVWILLLFGFEVSLSILKTKEWGCS